MNEQSAKSASVSWRTAASVERETRARDLSAQYAGEHPRVVIEAVAGGLFRGHAAIVSSFGAESAVLLALAAEVDPSLPVLFLDTHKLFPETLRYRDDLAERLGLTDVRTITPSPAGLAADDPDGTLHQTNPDLCCHVRKTLPLLRALKGFDAWFTGRKRHHGGDRADLPLVEVQDGRMKVNPLAAWDGERITQEMRARDLPAHPLVAQGYASIGCLPCTSRTLEGEDPRAGRWRDSDKTECGIHITDDGRVERVKR